jgi:single-strand DNA-binding protein
MKQRAVNVKAWHDSGVRSKVAGYNRCVFVGNLVRDPEVKYVDGGGKLVCKFALAVNRKGKGKDEVLFIDVIAWDKLGETCNTYLKKGSSCLVEGRLAVRKYEGKDGNKYTAVECIASGMTMLDKREGGGGSYASSGEAEAYAQSSTSTEPADDQIPF